MGFLDAIESMATQALVSQQGGSETAKVAGGLMQALQEHPGGVQGMIETMSQNGVGEAAQTAATGEATQMTPEQVGQGLGGTGLIESVAEKAGVSPEIAKAAMATILPMVIAHFNPGGQPAPQSAFGGLAAQMLTKFL